MSEIPNENPEAGLRNHRPEFIREDEFGTTPTGPEILKYSHTINNFTWASDSVNEPQRGLGDADPKGFIKGPETHELTVAYDVIKWFSATGDASYDGMARADDNLLPSSHTILDREDKGPINSNQTLGETSRPTRIYTVAKGALIDEVAVTGDPSDAQPVTSELSYLAQKTRSYQIDQPTEETGFTVESSSSQDTDQTLTIESEGAATTEDVSLDGTTVVGTSTETFGDIDALSLSGETMGDITVSMNDGTASSPTAGDDLSVIHGMESYRGVEGDLGIPAMGSGSREDVADQPVETFIGDQISRDGVEYPFEISSATLTVANNIEETERSNGFGMALHPGNRETTLEATMFGEAMTHDLLVQELTNTTNEITWELDGGVITLPGAIMDEPGERAAESEQAVMTTDNTFQSEGVTFGATS